MPSLRSRAVLGKTSTLPPLAKGPRNTALARFVSEEVTLQLIQSLFFLFRCNSKKITLRICAQRVGPVSFYKGFHLTMFAVGKVRFFPGSRSTK